jgi:vacuolar protein sorting-associated protein 13A/C
MSITEEQYVFLTSLIQSVPRAFSISAKEAEDQEESGRQMQARRRSSTVTSAPQLKSPAPNQTVDLLPELSPVARTDSGQNVPLWPDVELTLASQTIYLELFSAGVTSEESLKNSSLARFSLNHPALKLTMMSDSSIEAEFVIKSFAFHDTRPTKQTKWREIIPPSKHDGNQFMVSFSMTRGYDSQAIANVTLDTPTIIFSLDPLFALVSFFTSVSREDTKSATPPESSDSETESLHEDEAKSDEETPQQTLSLAFRVNISDAKVALLAEPERHDTEAIMLVIDRVQMAHQGTLVFTIEKMGVFFLKMDRREDRVRVLDDFNLSFSLDNHSERGRQFTNVEVGLQPLVLRTSYRDIFLATTIVNKAIELSNKASGKPEADGAAQDGTMVSAQSVQIAMTSAETRNRSMSIEKPQILMTQQTVIKYLCLKS